MMHNRNG